ncbi:Golgi resident protein GCP60 [Leptopilina heterotoma]|uniref:Golgi resident protein GCP60 n=1 Tax=Leptopilina heterotoma TaxID=63436 RepID=UPI001CA90050|nr:Golgi resident protein GCP60 [Leptopilina heterotoma]
MASTNGNNISSVEEKIEKLEISDENIKQETNESKSTKIFEPHLSGFEMRELYKIAFNFYKEKEGKAVHLSYEDKLKLVAFIQQVTHGKCTAENAPPLGVLDVIGKDRRLAWQNLGDISKEEAMEGFVVLLDKLCPLFKTVVEALKRDIEEKKRLQKEEEVKKVEEEKRLKELEEEKQKEEEERLKQENQRRQIQEALNQQTYHQFRAYAEQQYPGNPEQQGVLIRQLQEQHYHKYMQQLHQNQIIIEDHEPLKGDNIGELKIKESEDAPLLLNEEGTNDEDEEEDEQQDWPPIESPQMWTKEGVEDFKSMIKKEAGDAVIKVGHGETVTVRVPTHEDGSCLFWEFATDGYDIGFGVYFEWIKPDTNQVSVHISESEDEDDEDEDYDSREDLESGAVDGEPKQESSKPFVSRISVIVPVYRRDSQDEVYAGSHQYPGQGVYLLKFDNSYSLWRSKTLYYRVYYTRLGVTKN